MEGTARFLDGAGGGLWGCLSLAHSSMKLQAEKMGWKEEGWAGRRWV